MFALFRSHAMRGQKYPRPQVSGARGICLCLVILGIGLVVSQGAHHVPAANSSVAPMSIATSIPASDGGQTSTFKGAARGLADAPQPIPDSALYHCVLWSFLGNDFDPCFWFLKAVVSGVNWFLEWILNLLQGFITGLLSHDILFDTPTSVTTQNDAVIALVNDMRWVADAALVLIAMIAGFNLMIRPHLGLSYHDIAEFLPRYAIGAIGANFSLWFLGQLVDAGNLFMHFVGAAPLFTPQLTNLPPGANVIAVAFFGTIGVILYLTMLLLLILQIFVRLALLDFLIVISPLALICWILPQTQRATEWWAGLMGSTLVLQPLQLVMISLGITLATNIPLKDGLWGFDTVLLQLCLLIATFYLCFKLPALLNYGLFRSVGSVGSGFGVMAAVAQIAVAAATGNPAMAMGAVGGGGGGGGTTVTPVSPLSSSAGSGAPGLPAPSGGGGGGSTGGGALPAPSGGGGGGSGGGGGLPAPSGGGNGGGSVGPSAEASGGGAEGGGSEGSAAPDSWSSFAPPSGSGGGDNSSIFDDDPGVSGSQSTTAPPRRPIIDSFGSYAINDDAGPLT